MKIAIISLGCPKNQVDADVFCHALIKDGHTTVADPAEADIIIINTCGFIESAKAEASENILMACQYKQQNPDLKVVVTGCLAERYKQQIVQEIPEVDAVVGIGSNAALPAIVRRLCAAGAGQIESYGPKTDMQNLPDAVLLIVGDGPERAALEQQAQSLGVADRVIFVGAVPPAEVPRYYALGDVFVSASTSEAQGLTYIEAMAAGLPLLCHADPCLDALVREGETGWAYHTPAELAARAAALPKGHQLAAMRQNARRAVQPYTKEQFGLSVVRLYAAALGRKHAARSAAGGNVA